MTQIAISPGSSTVPSLEAGAAPRTLRATTPRAWSWLGVRHSLAVELTVVVGLYLVYDGSRGLAGGGRALAVRHAQSVEAFERATSIRFETGVERLARHVPGLVDLFGVGYSALHLTVTGATLIWLHRRHPDAFVTVRTAFLTASGLALAGFVAFPVAPPRLAGAGLAAAAAAHGPVNLESSTLQWFYNPYAAMPSLHIAYATLVGFALYRWGSGRSWRWVGLAYPVWVAAEVIATGNHFVIDVLAGAVAAGVALTVASALPDTSALPVAGRTSARAVEMVS
jgi:hypothetical protein